MTGGQLYRSELERFQLSIRDAQKLGEPRRLEWVFEGLADWGQHHTLDSAVSWLQEHRRNPGMSVQQIGLAECEGWARDPSTSNIVAESGDFFIVEGVRVTSTSRERGTSWDQPVITQVGYDGGVIGLLCQRFDGIPHYLVEAKAEPGNPGLVQLSPTLQATFANLRRAHGGRAPEFADLFLDPSPAVTVLHASWMSEDGGRLFNKRNRGMIIEAVPGTASEFSDRFTWMSLFQLKDIIRFDALASPHIRSLVSLM